MKLLKQTFSKSKKTIEGIPIQNMKWLEMIITILGWTKRIVKFINWLLTISFWEMLNIGHWTTSCSALYNVKDV